MNLLGLFAFKSSNREEPCSDDVLEHPIVFVERFWQCRDSLFLVACRILEDKRAAHEAVEACFRRACQNPPKFGCQGEFGGWLLRILINEAMEARRSRKRAQKSPCRQTLINSPAQADALLQCMDEFWCLPTTA